MVAVAGLDNMAAIANEGKADSLFAKRQQEVGT